MSWLLLPCRVVAAVGIQGWQQQHIAANFSMTEMLLKPVMTERILLQREIALAAHMDPMGALVGPEGARLGPSSAHLGPTSAQMDCAGASADCSALPTGPQQLRLAKQRQLLQAKLSRMSMLLKKEFTLKMILKAHQYSCLSWVQVINKHTTICGRNVPSNGLFSACTAQYPPK